MARTVFSILRGQDCNSEGKTAGRGAIRTVLRGWMKRRGCSYPDAKREGQDRPIIRASPPRLKCISPAPGLRLVSSFRGDALAPKYANPQNWLASPVITTFQKN